MKVQSSKKVEGRDRAYLGAAVNNDRHRNRMIDLEEACFEDRKMSAIGITSPLAYRPLRVQGLRLIGNHQFYRAAGPGTYQEPYELPKSLRKIKIHQSASEANESSNVGASTCIGGGGQTARDYSKKTSIVSLRGKKTKESACIVAQNAHPSKFDCDQLNILEHAHSEWREFSILDAAPLAIGP